MDESCKDFKKYICSICANFFIDPILTRCGHNFCNNCITTWLKNEQSCKVCQKDLEPSVDIFSDERMKRDIAQLSLPCPNAEQGCLKKLSPYDINDHVKACYYKISISSDQRYVCNFSGFGCNKYFTEESELQKHLTEFSQQHLNTLLEEYNTVREQLNNIKKEYDSIKMVMDEERRIRNSKIVELENQLKQKLQIIKTHKPLEDKLNAFFLLYIQLQDNEKGSIIWVVDGISDKITQLEKYFYSPEFFASPKGYRFQGSLFIDTNHLGIYVALMRSENDDQLQWPCAVLKYAFKIFHPDMTENKHYSRITSRPIPELHLARPNTDKNDGRGYTDFLHKNELEKFIKEDKIILQFKVIFK